MTSDHDPADDPVFNAINERQEARLALFEASSALHAALAAVNAAADRFVQKDRLLSSTKPTTKAGTVALLGYMASTLEPYEDVAPLALSALARAQQLLN